MNKKLIVLGWNPNYSPYEKMIFNKNKDQKLFSDRRLASIYANDTSEYFGIDVEVIPECDLPLDNIMEEEIKKFGVAKTQTPEEYYNEEIRRARISAMSHC